MKVLVLNLSILISGIQLCFAQQNVESEIKELSQNKWQWMADKKTEPLAALFDDKSVFVHMGGSWGKERELNIIKSGSIHYKKADIHEVSVNIINDTAILLNKITWLLSEEMKSPILLLSQRSTSDKTAPGN